MFISICMLFLNKRTVNASCLVRANIDASENGVFMKKSFSSNVPIPPPTFSPNFVMCLFPPISQIFPITWRLPTGEGGPWGTWNQPSHVFHLLFMLQHDETWRTPRKYIRPLLHRWSPRRPRLASVACILPTPSKLPSLLSRNPGIPEMGRTLFCSHSGRRHRKWQYSWYRQRACRRPSFIIHRVRNLAVLPSPLTLVCSVTVTHHPEIARKEKYSMFRDGLRVNLSCIMNFPWPLKPSPPYMVFFFFIFSSLFK